MARLYNRMDGLPPPVVLTSAHAHDDDDNENHKNIFASY